MIQPERVEEIFLDCLFRDDEVEDGKVKDPSTLCEVEGIVSNYGFHKYRLESRSGEIREMLEALPSTFRKSGGGGMTFLNMCLTSDGDLWTDLHQRAEQLLALSVGLGLAGYCFPREMWRSLPGSVPYVWIDL